MNDLPGDEVVCMVCVYGVCVCVCVCVLCCVVCGGRLR